MFWGAFGASARTTLNVLLGDPESQRGGVTARVILTTLRSELPTILAPGSIFMQDNAPVHTARLVQNWLHDWAEENGIRLLDWPAYSPDLNPIENLWKMIKERVIEAHPELLDMGNSMQALDLLEMAAVEAWEGLEDRVLQNLIHSMRRRLQAVINADGWYTKY